MTRFGVVYVPDGTWDSEVVAICSLRDAKKLAAEKNASGEYDSGHFVAMAVTSVNAATAVAVVREIRPVLGGFGLGRTSSACCYLA
jgi:hypothetical protein